MQRARIIATGVLALLVGSVGTAVALGRSDVPVTEPVPVAEPVSVPDVVAPVQAATEWLGGPIDDVTDPEVLTYLVGSGVVGAPGRAIDALAEVEADQAGFAALAQATYDGLLHMRPGLALAHVGDTGHPAYTPDWDGDGRFGEAEDYDHDMDAEPSIARFRYPCTGLDGQVTFERLAGGCGPDQGRDDLATGIAREVKIVNARGLVLDATIWLPEEALVQSCRSVGVPACAAPSNVRPGQPSVVFNNGLASRQDHYGWYATALARAGYTVLTYDPAGQASSEGTVLDLFASHEGCSGSCLDAQDVLRWWVGGTILPVDAGQQRLFSPGLDPTAVAEGGDNVPNPYRGALDLRRVAISGNSLGAGATVAYLNAVTDGAGYDGRALPPVAAAIPLSIPGETRVSAPVPFLTVSGDLDGLPLVAPAILGAGWGDDAQRMYAKLRRQRAPQSAVGVVIIEGGMHTDHVDQPGIGSTRWGIAVTERYAIPWLDCHLRGSASQCAALLQASPHLSRAYASQIDLDGSGPLPNVCLQAPDQLSLGHEPEALLAALAGQHATCDP